MDSDAGTVLGRHGDHRVAMAVHPYPLAGAGRRLLDDDVAVAVDVGRCGQAAPEDGIRGMRSIFKAHGKSQRPEQVQWQLFPNEEATLAGGSVPHNRGNMLRAHRLRRDIPPT